MGHVILFWCRSYERRSRGCNNFCGPENLGYTLHIFRKLQLSLCYKEFLSHSFFKEIALMKCKETLQTDCLLTKFMMQRNKCQRWHLLEKSQNIKSQNIIDQFFNLHISNVLKQQINIRVHTVHTKGRWVTVGPCS